MEATDFAALVLRIALGSVFLAHGIKHARGREKTTKWFGSIGFRKPGLQWMASTATEIGVGVLLLVGLLTSLAAAAVVGIMFVAFWSVHRPVGFWVTARPDEGWEYVYTLSMAAIALAAIGPGSWSVDAAFGIAEDFDGWLGVLIAVVGIPISIGQLATFYRPDKASQS
ncbi:MAG: DoxX family protein [Acidimicrobiia bacterium]|nr:DoxX family protein [Acidimicrobiia bacterium]NNL27225.1 DoxX family protein [Acidimicrobiia bacterium]